MMSSQVEERGDDLAHDTKASPADRLVSNLDGEYFKLTEAAVIVGVSPTTLRRLMRRKGVGLRAPSYKIQQGKMLVYLYSADDINELRLYFAAGRVPGKRHAS